MQYENTLNTLIADVQLSEEHAEGYRAYEGDDGHSLFVDEESCEEKRGDCRSARREGNDIIAFITPSHNAANFASDITYASSISFIPLSSSRYSIHRFSQIYLRNMFSR